MGWPINTKLICTNPELISSGTTFFEKIKEDFIWHEDDKPVYGGVSSEMHQELTKISENYPEEVFCRIDYYKSADNNADKTFGAYINGRYNTITTEPYYYFIPESFEGVDPEIDEQFKQHMMLYVRRIDLLKKTKDQITFDFPYDKDPSQQGFSSDFEVNWRNKEHTFHAYKDYGSEIEVNYKRIPKRVQKPKEPEEPSNDSDNEFDQLPF